MGVLAVIKQVVRMPDNTYQVLIEAQERARPEAPTPKWRASESAETKSSSRNETLED